MSQVDLEYWKSRFLTYWPQYGHNAFPYELKSQYLDEIKESAPALTIRKSWAREYLQADLILDAVLLADKDLSIFKRYVELFEDLSPKAYQFLKLQNISANIGIRLKALKTMRNQSLSPGGWALREVKQTSSLTKVVVAKDTLRTMSAKLEEAQMTPEVWSQVLTFARESIPGAKDLTAVRVHLTASNVFQFALEFDWTTNQVQIESDMTDWLGETSKKNELRATRLEAVAYIATEADLTGQISVLNDLVTKPVPVDPDLHTKLDREVAKDHLFIIVGGKFHVKGEDGQNDEEVNAHLLSYLTANLIKDVGVHYRLHRSLVTFLDSFGSYDRDRTRVQSSLSTSDSQRSCQGFFVQIFPKKPLEKDEVDFEVEVLNFKYEQKTADWDVKNPTYSRRVRDAFISKLHEISGRPTRIAAPPAGSPTPAPVSDNKTGKP